MRRDLLVPTILAILAVAGKGRSVRQVLGTEANSSASLQAGFAACAQLVRSVPPWHSLYRRQKVQVHCNAAISMWCT